MKNFRVAHDIIRHDFKQLARVVPPNIWQGIDVSTKPEMATHELEDYTFNFPMGTEDLTYHRQMICPNLPWADDHFEKDRVSGEPLNPGYTWKQWPYALKADEFRNEHGQFNHSYAERYWPKFAGKGEEGKLLVDNPEAPDGPPFDISTMKPNFGIRYSYGDLSDVVNLLVKNPLTRNAYMPVWHPEDTGVIHGGRTPCSIGYLFRMRENRLSVFYDIRSCDFVRHFKDDVYLTIRLALWMLTQCRMKDAKWCNVKPGQFSMHIGSFHIFANDWQKVMSV